MAPVKFEDNIKDKLEQRTILPSESAWDQLSAQLDQEEKKNSRALFFYMGIAASIVGILLVTSIFFKSADQQEQMPSVVESSQEHMPEEVNEPLLRKAPENKVAATVDKPEKDNHIKEFVPSEESPLKNTPEMVIAHENEDIDKRPRHQESIPLQVNESPAVAIENTANISKKDVEEPLNTLSFEDAKVLEVIADIQKLEIKNGVVTDAEIENLLKQAEKEILRDRIYNETTRTVDADALLQDVEDDLERSFRTRVFESLKSSYRTVKTAVAERNN